MALGELSRKVGALIVLPLLALFLVSCASVQPGNSVWDKPVADIEATFRRALVSYEKGDAAGAQQSAKDAYFEVFESSGLETAMRLGISARRAAEVEGGFADVRRLLRAGAQPAEVRASIGDLMSMIREDVEQLGGRSGGTAGFAASFLIIIREGFEAILIIGAIVAYLVKSGNRDKVRTIYYSSLLAVLASIATAVAVRWLFNLSGASQEVLEGATMLLAVVVLFSVSFWLLGKVQAEKWQQYIQNKLERSLSAGGTLALESVAFLAVYREGAETVLFYQSLLSGPSAGQAGSIGLGLAAGVLVLAVIFFAIRWGSIRMPIKPFFVGTGILLYLLAFTLAGKGVRELQEADVLGASPISGLPMVDLLGIYPNWQGVALQLALLVVAGAGLTYQFLYKPRLERAKTRAAV